MKVCEICGKREDSEAKEHEAIESVILHVCESCREDRKWSQYENWVF
jgi:ribosome-binding protein aMBF1 (putative translation factor)